MSSERRKRETLLRNRKIFGVKFNEWLTLFQDNARIGDEFMRQIQSIAAYVPYMTCPGNHEAT